MSDSPELRSAAMTEDSSTATTVTVPLSHLTGPRVPQLCVKTGEKAQCLVPTQATATPAWAWILVLLGGWPLFAARRWWFARAPLALPARNYVYDRLEWTKRGVAGCFAVAALGAVGSVVTLNPVGVLAAWILAVVTTAGWLLIVPRYWVGAQLLGDQVCLRGVHPTTAAALARA
jgi:hypothetical protein